MEYFYTAYVTDIGTKKKTNQDSLLLKGITSEEGEALLAVLCDGMGGMSKGELASAMIVRGFSEWFLDTYTQKGRQWTADDIKRQWRELLTESNEKLIRYGEENHIQLGTTVTAILLFSSGEYLIGHIGDTRAYQISNNNIKQLTEDHTFVAREIRRGNMTPEEAEQDTRRNVLLQCIGVNTYFESQYVEGSLASGEAVLLCSDGFRHRVSEKEMHQELNPGYLREETLMEQKLTELVELNKKRQETDNITAIYIKRK